jgi:hypothetical protein
LLRSKTIPISDIFSRDLTIPVILAFFQLILLTVFHENYGYFRDELYYIACSNHLAFGYVDQPPLSIAILWINRLFLGDSLGALRFLPALVGAIVVLLAALMTRKLGGSKFAQSLAALSVVAAHGLIGHGRTFSMNPFDVLFWSVAGYILVVILIEEKSKLWILFGFVVGLGLLNKYSIGFMIIGLAAGLLLTRQRKQFYSKWFWLGGVVAFIVFLPHIIWQIIYDFPSLEFMRNASQNKNVNLNIIDFLIGQLRDMNIINAFLWIGGIYFFYKYKGGRLRPLAWMYPVVFFVMVAGNAKVYYLSAIYPIFLAGGAVFFEQYIQLKSINWLRTLYVGLLSIIALVILPFAVPVLPVEQFIRYEYTLGLTPHAEEKSSVGELPQYYADQFGWREMVDTIANVYKKLTPEEQSQCVIYVRNYGEAAAIDFFGTQQGLPNARCGHNNYWLWGPGNLTGDVAIIIGGSRGLEKNLSDLRSRYKYVEFAATTNAKYAMPFENGRMIFICKGMNSTFQILWPWERFYI